MSEVPLDVVQNPSFHLKPQPPPQPSNRATSGMASVTVIGANLATIDYTPKGRVGETGGQATVWASDSSIVVRTPGGWGGAYDVGITVGLAAGTLTGVFTFDAPPVVTDLVVRTPLPAFSVLSAWKC